MKLFSVSRPAAEREDILKNLMQRVQSLGLWQSTIAKQLTDLVFYSEVRHDTGQKGKHIYSNF